MKVMRNLVAAAALLAAPGISAANTLGTYAATNSKYVILGTVSSELTTGNTLTVAYSAATDLNNDTTVNRIVASDGSNYSAHSDDDDSIAFVDGGVVGLRANGAFTLTLTLPMAKIGSSSCIPVFDAAVSDASVSAYMTVVLSEAGGSTIESYAVDDKTSTGTSSSLVASCAAADSSNGFIDPAGTLVMSVSPTKTTEYSLAIDIGFETGGSFTTSGSAATTFGDNGEPVADTYTLSLQLTAASTN